MSYRIAGLMLSLMVTPLVAGPLAGQVTPPGIWPEKTLSPAQKDLKDAVVILRDTLRVVQSTSERLERAHLAGRGAVLTSSARSLAVDCERAARSASWVQARIGGFSTSEERGDAVLEQFRRSLLTLQRDMTTCNTDALSALAASPHGDRLLKIRTLAVKATARYEMTVEELMKTLGIPLDPKGHKSAIQI
ncbi:MAG: hypothetical protein H0W15_02815 [Gemmatimonadales bacterium]|nr:hypothetical protein [Gemmatimonadales bacterium]